MKSSASRRPKRLRVASRHRIAPFAEQPDDFFRFTRMTGWRRRLAGQTNERKGHEENRRCEGDAFHDTLLMNRSADDIHGHARHLCGAPRLAWGWPCEGRQAVRMTVNELPRTVPLTHTCYRT